MKLKAFVVIGSLAFVPATHSAAESWGDPSAAAGFGDLTLDAAPAEAQATPQAITPSTEAPTAFTPAAAAPVPAGLGTVKLEEENGGAPAKGQDRKSVV